MLRITSKRQSACERGGVLVELSLVAPILILLIVAVAATGSLLGQLAWMSQTAFQTYLIGAEYLTDTERLGPMEGRAQLLELNNSSLSRNAERLDTNAPPFMSFTYNPTDDSLTATVRGRLETLLGPRASFGLSMSVTGALLAVDGGSATPLNRYFNPARRYNCQGVQCPVGDPVCGTQACVTCNPALPQVGNCSCSVPGSPYCP